MLLLCLKVRNYQKVYDFLKFCFLIELETHVFQKTFSARTRSVYTIKPLRLDLVIDQIQCMKAAYCCNYCNNNNASTKFTVIITMQVRKDLNEHSEFQCFTGHSLSNRNDILGICVLS